MRSSELKAAKAEATYASFLPTCVGLLLIYMRRGAVMDHFFIVCFLQDDLDEDEFLSDDEMKKINN